MTKAKDAHESSRRASKHLEELISHVRNCIEVYRKSMKLLLTYQSFNYYDRWKAPSINVSHNTLLKLHKSVHYLFGSSLNGTSLLRLWVDIPTT